MDLLYADINVQEGGPTLKRRRYIAAVLACLLTSAVALLATQAPAGADPQVGEAALLINAGSGKCFAPTPVGDRYDLDALPIQQRGCGSFNGVDKFTFLPLGYVLFNEGPPWWCINCIHLGSEGYLIRDHYTGKCLDVRDGATSDWAVVQQATCLDANARSMVWYTEPGDYMYMLKLKNFNSDLCLDVAWGSSDDLAQIQQFHCTSNNLAQNFMQSTFLIPTGSVAVPNTVGMSESNARQAITAAGLIVGTVSQVVIYDGSSFGLVLNQDPPAGSLGQMGITSQLTTKVNIRIAQQPPDPPGGEGSCRVVCP